MTPIQRFARARLQIDRLMADHRPIPQHLANEYQSLIAWANTNLTPEQTVTAMQMVAAEQDTLLREERQSITANEDRQFGDQRVEARRGAILAQALRDRSVKNITRNMSNGGMNQKQFQQVLSEGKYVDERPSRREGIQENMRRRGLKETPEQLVAKLDAILDDKKQLSAYLDEHAGPDIVERNRLEEKLHTMSIGTTLQLRREKEVLERNPDAFKPVTVEVDERAKRRADILSEVARHDDGSGIEDKIERSSLIDPGSRGDVARAMALVDERDDPLGAHEPNYGHYEQLERLDAELNPE